MPSSILFIVAASIVCTCLTTVSGLTSFFSDPSLTLAGKNRYAQLSGFSLNVYRLSPIPDAHIGCHVTIINDRSYSWLPHHPSVAWVKSVLCK